MCSWLNRQSEDAIDSFRPIDRGRERLSRLLPTSSHDDAVTFGYGAVANSDRDFHPANSTHSRAYTKPLARYRTTLNDYSLWPHRKGYSKADVATVR